MSSYCVIYESNKIQTKPQADLIILICMFIRVHCLSKSTTTPPYQLFIIPVCTSKNTLPGSFFKLCKLECIWFVSVFLSPNPGCAFITWDFLHVYIEWKGLAVGCCCELLTPSQLFYGITEALSCICNKICSRSRSASVPFCLRGVHHPPSALCAILNLRHWR